MACKYNDGDHISLYCDDYPGWEPIKGWHDEKHCQLKLNESYGEGEAARVIRVEHKYAFWGVGQDEMGDPCQIFYDRDEPGRGRFKVTLAHTSVFDDTLSG